jgi:tetratricopeptide (TPR) repeat protein
MGLIALFGTTANVLATRADESNEDIAASSLFDLLDGISDEDESPFSPHPVDESTLGVTAHASNDEHEHLEMAITHFRSALLYDDEHCLARTWLGRCYWLQKRYDLARCELDRVVKGGHIYGHVIWTAWYSFACDGGDDRHYLGLTYRSLGMDQKARECFMAALQFERVATPLHIRGLEVMPREFQYN